MTNTLCPELDKLRNKELSFWCMLELNEKAGMSWYIQRWNNFILLSNNAPKLYVKHWNTVDQEEIFIHDVKNIIWHPLTRGRIIHLSETIEVWPWKRGDMDTMDERVANIEKWVSIFGSIKIFLANHKLYDQNELQRITSEKRPELKKLLVEFSKYL